MTTQYKHAGVQTTEELRDFPHMLEVLRTTLSLRDGQLGKPRLDFGYYANVLNLGNNVGLAISTDGVGTKILIAESMRKYDTIGIDCVAMNVNDVICVGAEPIAMTDYIAIAEPDSNLLSELAKGLKRGAELSRITIPGGEVAQVREIVKGIDLVGTCVGLVEWDRVLNGETVRAGDAIIGFASTGIHSNGLTLARDVLVAGDTKRLFEHVPELGRSLGEELLEPTRIYVSLAMRLLHEVDGVHALAHITSDGFLNLARVDAKVGFEIDFLPDPPAIFSLIQKHVGLPEMFLVYNMGIGFCAIVAESDVERVLSIALDEAIDAWRIGTCTEDPHKVVTISTPSVRLRSAVGHFEAF